MRPYLKACLTFHMANCHLRYCACAPLVQLVKDIEDALEYLDNHFTFNKEQMEGLTNVSTIASRATNERSTCLLLYLHVLIWTLPLLQMAMGHRMSRMDTSILAAAADLGKQPVRPC